MADAKFYVPDAMTVKLPVSGRVMRLWRGLHSLPKELVDHAMGNDLGIIPENEMTDAHYRASGLKRPEVKKAEAPSLVAVAAPVAVKPPVPAAPVAVATKP